MKIYIINDQSERESCIAYENEEDAIKHIEEVSGKKQKDWGWDTGDYIDDSDDMIWYTEGELYAKLGKK